MRFDKEYNDYLHGKCKNYNQGLIEALEEMEKENKGNNMKNDGRCVNCGRVRVEGSTLCADCLAACEVGRKHGNEEIVKLKIQLRLQRRLLQHVFLEYQELQVKKDSELKKSREIIDECMDEIHGPEREESCKKLDGEK